MDKFRFDENIEPREVSVKKVPKFQKEKDESPYPEFLYAGFFIRLFSFLVDLIISGTIAQIILNLLSLLEIVLPSKVNELVFIFLRLTYFTVMTYLNEGQTLGKMIFSLRVVQLDGEKLSLSTVFIREFIGRFILDFGILWILYIMIVFTDKNQSLADIFADTSVVSVSKENAYENGKKFIAEV